MKTRANDMACSGDGWYHDDEKMTITIKQILEDLGMDSDLTTKNSDSQDFREVAVWQIKAMLEAAYKEGRNSK